MFKHLIAVATPAALVLSLMAPVSAAVAQTPHEAAGSSLPQSSEPADDDAALRSCEKPRCATVQTRWTDGDGGQHEQTCTLLVARPWQESFWVRGRTEVRCKHRSQIFFQWRLSAIGAEDGGTCWTYKPPGTTFPRCRWTRTKDGRAWHLVRKPSILHTGGGEVCGYGFVNAVDVDHEGFLHCRKFHVG